MVDVVEFAEEKQRPLDEIVRDDDDVANAQLNEIELEAFAVRIRKVCRISIRFALVRS